MNMNMIRKEKWVKMWPKGSKNPKPELRSPVMKEEMARVPSMGELSSISYSDGVLPPLGAQSNRKIKLRCFIVSPFDRRYRAWEIFLVALVFYTAWVSPFEFGFLRGPKGPLAITDNVVNGCFAIDIVLTFFVAYLEKSMYVFVDSPKEIAWRYAKGGLIFDVVSIIPSELVGRIFPSNGESYGYFSMLRLWRLRRVSKMFERLEKDRNFSYTFVRFAKLTCVVLFSVHCSACLFYLIADRYKDPKKTWVALSLENFHEAPVWDKYVMSIYWSITTATTTGYGDLHPVNTREMLFDLVYILFLLGFSSYIIGNMTNLIVQSTSRTMKFRDTINAARSFSKRNRLPHYLQDQMVAHLSLKYRTDSEGLQQQETLDALPKAIRSSITHYLFSSLVDKVYLFKGVSNDLLFQLVTEMKPEYFPLGEDIIIENEAPTDLYILVNGAVDLISKRDRKERVIGELKTGDVCGEIGVLCYRPRLFTVRTKRLSQLLRLNRTALFNILRANVADASMIMNNLLEHLKGYEDPVLQEILSYTEQMLVHGKTDMPLSLCFAAARGYDILLNHMLGKGSDPNELDSNGRAALHLASAVGSLECVLLLLDNGANPNVKDSEGNVPLWEAILGKHEAVIKVLIDNGATLSSGDVGQFACFVAEENNMELLNEIIKFGGDVTLPSYEGTTALHTAISEENAEIVKFLIERGADVDKPDVYGCTPRTLANNHCGSEEIRDFIRDKPETKTPFVRHGAGENPKHDHNEAPYLRKYSNQGSSVSGSRKMSLSNIRSRSRPSNFQNSLVGIITTGQKQNGSQFLGSRLKGGRSALPRSSSVGLSHESARVTVSCPEKGDRSGKLVLLPGSLRELLDLGCQKFGFRPTRVLTRSGYLVEDFALIRDGDHLILASET